MKLTLRYYLVIIACCGFLASSIGLSMNTYGIFYVPVGAALGVGRSDISLHTSLCVLTTGLISPITVKLMKKYSFLAVTLGGITLTIASYILMTLANKVWMFNVLGIVRGIGNSSIYNVVASMIIGNWFKHKQGTIFGIVAAFAGISGAIFSPVLTEVITSHGYKAAYLACAGIVAVLSIPLTPLISLSPEDIGFEPYTGKNEDPAKNNMPEPSENSTLPHPVNKLVYLSPLFILLAVMTFFNSYQTNIIQHVSGYAQSIGYTAAFGASMMSAVMIGNITGKTAFGVIADRISPYTTNYIFICVFTAGIIIMLLAPGSMTLLIIGSFMFGIVYATGSVGSPIIVRSLYGNKQYGSAFSIIMGFGSVGGALATFTMGLIYDAAGSYTASLLIGILLSVAVTVCIIVIKKIGQKRAVVVEN